MPRLLLLASCCFSACSTPSFDESAGRGLVSVDRAAPASDNSAPMPNWQRGDRFTYRRGGKIRMELLVADKQADGYILQEVSSGIRFGMGLDLSRRSETVPGAASQDRQFAPADQVLTWPLWVGKKWSCEYLLKTLAGDA
ncbi:MAG: hypothetical protein ACYTG5_19000, partial [Planctomycetota bacterium]